MNFEWYIRSVGRWDIAGKDVELVYIGEGKEGRNDHIPIRGLGYNLVVQAPSREESKKCQDALLQSTEVILGQRPSIRRLDDPKLQAFITVINSLKTSSSSPLITEDKVKSSAIEGPLWYSLPSFCNFFKKNEAVHQGKKIDDIILTTYHFTNNDRNLDRVSRLMRRLLEEHAGDNLVTRIYNLIIMRLLSNQPGIESYGWPLTKEERGISVDQAFSFYKKRPWVSAQANSNTPKQWKELWTLAEPLAKFTPSTTSLAKIREFIFKSNYPCLSGSKNFSAYQVTLDLQWLFPHLNGDWAEFRTIPPIIKDPNHPKGKYEGKEDERLRFRGSGAVVCLIKNMPVMKTAKCARGVDPEVLNAAIEIRNDCIPYIGRQPMHVIEHSMCEYSKYIRKCMGISGLEVYKAYYAS
jgi:hypothetical protein